MHTHIQKSENANANSDNTYHRCAHAHTHTHKQQHRNTCIRHLLLQRLEDNVLRHIRQYHSWVRLIIPDSIERSIQILFSRTHHDRCCARTHTLTRKHQHSNACTRHLQSLDDNVLRNIIQHHSWVCLIIPDSIERSHLICFTCSTLFLTLLEQEQNLAKRQRPFALTRLLSRAHRR